MRFVKPLDRAMLVELARSHEGLVTLEDNVVAGGAGSGVAELFAAEGVTLPILHLRLPDEFSITPAANNYSPKPVSMSTASAPQCWRAGRNWVSRRCVVRWSEPGVWTRITESRLRAVRPRHH